MSAPNERPAIAHEPLSLLLMAQALSPDIAKTLHNWRLYLDSLHRPYEIILLQETRPEAEPMAAESLQAAYPRLRLIPYSLSQGHREALSEAIQTAQYPLLVFCACESAYQPLDLERMLKVIDQVDLIVGYRMGQPIPVWLTLLDTLTMVLSRVVIGVPLMPRTCWLGPHGRGRRWIARWVFRLRVEDPECPYRLARRELLQRLRLQSRGPFVQIEMLAKANHLGALIAEEPVSWGPEMLPEEGMRSVREDFWHVFREPQFLAGTPSTPAANSEKSPLFD